MQLKKRTGSRTESWGIATLKDQEEKEGPTKEIKKKQPIRQEEMGEWCPGSQEKKVYQEGGRDQLAKHLSLIHI